MYSAFVMVFLAQLIMPCSPGEGSAVCTCKAGAMSVCAGLAGSGSEGAASLLDQVETLLDTLNALQMAGKASDQDKDKIKKLQEMEQALAGDQTPEPPNCKGQEHHIISRRVARQLEEHPILKGRFKPRDSRYVTQANDEQAHCGYQDWHRKVDEELIKWLKQRQNATPKDFLDKLREVYSRPEMKARFPNGF